MSPTVTVSPGDFSHWMRTASSMAMPSAGTKISSIVRPSATGDGDALRGRRDRQSSVRDVLLGGIADDVSDSPFA